MNKWVSKSHGIPKYYLIYVPEHPYCRSDGSILEHRYIMEKKLGRHLKRSEVVHHIDGDGFNNSPNNLELFSNSKQHSSHKHRQYQGWFKKGCIPSNKTAHTFSCLNCGKILHSPPAHKHRKTCSHKCKWQYLHRTRYII